MRLKRTKRTRNVRGEVLVPDSQRNHRDGISIKIEYDMTDNPMYTIEGGKIQGKESVYTIDSLYRQGPFDNMEEARVSAIKTLKTKIIDETPVDEINIEFPDAPRSTQQRI